MKTLPDGPPDAEAAPNSACGSSVGSDDRRQFSSPPVALAEKAPELEPRDEYDDLLDALGRTEEQDHRIAFHEAGHIIVARVLGHPLGGATINPGDGYEGKVWGAGHEAAFGQGRGDASSVRAVLAPAMPSDGEDRTAVADIFGSVYTQCVELLAGSASETLMLGECDSRAAGDDRRQARELLLLFCSSEEAIETFIAHCELAARDFLIPHGDLLTVLSITLRIRRTILGTDLDQIIADTKARSSAEMERWRRKQWQQRVENAATFQCEKVSRVFGMGKTSQTVTSG